MFMRNLKEPEENMNSKLSIGSFLFRCLSLFAVLFATNALVPSATWAYDAHTQASTVYDGTSFQAFGYDSAAVLVADEKENRTAVTSHPFAGFPEFLAAKTPLWTSTKSKTAVENAFGHWQKQGAEFPEFQNAKQYVEGTKSFFNNPPAGTLTKARPNGDSFFYNPANNTFGVQAADGAPRTMFRPTDGINYWNKQ